MLLLECPPSVPTSAPQPRPWGHCSCPFWALLQGSICLVRFVGDWGPIPLSELSGPPCAIYRGSGHRLRWELLIFLPEQGLPVIPEDALQIVGPPRKASSHADGNPGTSPLPTGCLWVLHPPPAQEGSFQSRKCPKSLTPDSESSQFSSFCLAKQTKVKILLFLLEPAKLIHTHTHTHTHITSLGLQMKALVLITNLFFSLKWAF